MSRPFRTKLNRLNVARMVSEEPPPLPWIVNDLVVKGMVTVMNGREGEKKSLLSQALSAAVDTGTNEGGFVCHPGRVVVVDAENGEGEIHRRVWTLGLSEDVEMFEADGFDLRKDIYDLEQLVDKHEPDLLVLDSFRSLWTGKENDSDDVSAALDPLRSLAHRTNTGVWLLHHSGKGTGDYRGSTAIGASAELGFKLARAEEDPDPSRCYLECWKCRPAPKPPRRWFRLAVDDGRVSFDEAEPFEGVPQEQQAPVRDELAPRVLAELSDIPRKRSDIARAIGRDPKDRTVGRILEKHGQKTDQGWVASGNPYRDLPPATFDGNGSNPHFEEWERLKAMSR